MTWIMTLWKYRKLAGWGLLLAALLGTHAWAYYSGKDAEQNRVDRARLERIEADHLASLAVMEQFLSELRRIQSTTEVVEREIIKHVPSDPACDLGPDALRLLNQGRGY
jgi:hypothetical protein